MNEYKERMIRNINIAIPDTGMALSQRASLYKDVLFNLPIQNDEDVRFHETRTHRLKLLDEIISETEVSTYDI